MAKGINCEGVDSANRDHSGCGGGCMTDSEICTSKFPPSSPSPSYFHRKESQRKAIGDVFYGDDDYEEIHEHEKIYYKEDHVMESMRKASQIKAINKKKKQRNNDYCWSFFPCFRFLKLLLGCGTK